MNSRGAEPPEPSPGCSPAGARVAEGVVSEGEAVGELAGELAVVAVGTPVDASSVGPGVPIGTATMVPPP
jgi:hypothetical protein